ncbi:YbaB/EbfC family nucleoid-associated protein [Nocardia salmonicida]|uniref:YbaB/EbfC family nucleoid-associated protein n=1 Tax=Nocardia salmonicida TaxID=53431 RepID=UPI0036B5B6D5
MIRPENANTAGDTADLIDAVGAALNQMKGLRGASDALTASATAEHGRITVVVNTSGSIIETRYADDINDLSYGQIARSTVQAAQSAAAKVAAKREALMAPVARMRSRMPKPEELFEGLAELRAQMPTHIPAPLTSPADRPPNERRTDGHRILDR